MGPLNRPKINKNPSLDLKVSFLVLPNVPGSSQDRPRVPQDAKVEAPSMPNDTYGRLFWSKVHKKLSKLGP